MFGGSCLSVEINPRQLNGPWDEGYALDIHTLSSTPIGYDSYGHMMFDTTYSPVGELLYRLKSRADPSVVPSLVDAIEAFWAKSQSYPFDLIVPVPPTKQRKYPPVLLVATALSERVKVPLCTDCIVKVKQTAQLKDLLEYDKRMAALDGAFTVAPALTEGKEILLFDDLYRSGATVSAITNLLKGEGKAKAVRLLTLTRTRSKT
jgi:predicted amidophosphoribosyltransferase